MRQGFSSQDLKTRDETPRATGGMHVKGVPHAKTRPPRKNHDHRVMLGKLPMNHGASFSSNKVISNNNGPDRSTNQTMKAAKRQVEKHRVSLRSC